MEATLSKGISGKARRARDRNRAARLSAKHMIDEYDHSQANDGGTERYIPIRGRKEFVPSAALSKIDVHARPSDAQHATQSKPKTVRVDTTCKPSGAATASRPGSPGSNGGEPIRFPGPTRSGRHATLAREMLFRHRQSFRLRGFLIGIGLGSMAASVLLLGLHTVIR